MYGDHVSNALGMALYDARGEMCAVAGATDNGEYLWELGINSFSDGHGAYCRNEPQSHGYGQSAVL